MSAFVKRLGELDWVEGDNVSIEYQWADGSSKRVSEIAAQYLQQNVDVIVTYGAAVNVLKQVAATVPIVFAVAFDPVRSGLVETLTAGPTVTMKSYHGWRLIWSIGTLARSLPAALQR